MKKWNKVVLPVLLAGLLAMAVPIGASAFNLGGALGGITKSLPGGSGSPSPAMPGGTSASQETTGRAYVEENGSRAPLPYVNAYAGTNLRVVSENGTEVLYGECHSVGGSDESGVLHLDPPAGVYTIVFWRQGYTSQTMQVTVPCTLPDVVLHPGGNKTIDFRK